jgi:hypothetical protein
MGLYERVQFFAFAGLFFLVVALTTPMEMVVR